MTNRARIEKIISDLKEINSVEKEDFIGNVVEILQDGIDDEIDEDAEVDLEGDFEDSERESEDFDDCI